MKTFETTIRQEGPESFKVFEEHCDTGHTVKKLARARQIAFPSIILGHHNHGHNVEVKEVQGIRVKDTTKKSTQTIAYVFMAVNIYGETCMIFEIDKPKKKDGKGIMSRYGEAVDYFVENGCKMV